MGANLKGGQHGANFGPNKHRKTSAVVTSLRSGVRVKIAAVQEVENQTVEGLVARNDMDTHADTCCAGANWRPMAFTGLNCDVSPYSEEYAPIRNVPVATCATAVTDFYGVTTILVCHQMMWFGTKLSHSLINPNQIYSEERRCLTIRLR